MIFFITFFESFHYFFRQYQQMHIYKGIKLCMLFCTLIFFSLKKLRFIGVSFKSSKLHSFYCIILWVWQICGVVCGYHNQDMKYFLPQPEVPWSPFCTEPSTLPQSLATTGVRSVSRVLPCLGPMMQSQNVEPFVPDFFHMHMYRWSVAFCG